MKILVVDDSAEMRRLIKNLIGDIADEIYECTDGARAIEMYIEHRPDWVLMDIEMQQMSGIAATAEIKAAFPKAKIVIVTNHRGDGLRKTAAVAGACGYILKENLLDLRALLTMGALAA